MNMCTPLSAAATGVKLRKFAQTRQENMITPRANRSGVLASPFPTDCCEPAVALASLERHADTEAGTREKLCSQLEEGISTRAAFKQRRFEILTRIDERLNHYGWKGQGKVLEYVLHHDSE